MKQAMNVALGLLVASCTAEVVDKEVEEDTDEEETTEETGVMPCTIAASLGDLGVVNDETPGVVTADSVGHITTVANDAFFLTVDLVKRDEAQQDPFPSGTIDLSKQSDLDTCTTCIALIRRADGVALVPVAGSLTVDALDVGALPGRFAATLRDITFAQIEFDGDGLVRGKLLANGCRTTVTNATFDTAVDVPDDPEGP
jgi:hypothetical protein